LHSFRLPLGDVFAVVVSKDAVWHFIDGAW